MLIQITASRSGVRVLLEPRCDLTMNFRTLALAFCIAFPCLPVPAQTRAADVSGVTGPHTPVPLRVGFSVAWQIHRIPIGDKDA